MSRTRTIIATAAAALGLGLVSAAPASAATTYAINHNSGSSYTGAIMHACSATNNITGPAAIAQPGQKVKLTFTSGLHLCIWVPAHSTALISEEEFGIKSGTKKYDRSGATTGVDQMYPYIVEGYGDGLYVLLIACPGCHY